MIAQGCTTSDPLPLQMAQIRTNVNAALANGSREDAKRIIRNAAANARQQGNMELERQLCSMLAYIVFSRSNLL